MMEGDQWRASCDDFEVTSEQYNSLWEILSENY
jgi:hypothetical protein